MATGMSELSRFPGVDDCAQRVKLAESVAKSLQQARKSFEAIEGGETTETGQYSCRYPKIWKKMPIQDTRYSLQQGNMNCPSSRYLPASAICGGFRDDMRSIEAPFPQLPDSRYFPARCETQESSQFSEATPGSSAVYRSPIRGFVNATSADYNGSGRIADRENCNRPTKKPRTQDIGRKQIPQAHAEQRRTFVKPVISQQAGFCDLQDCLLTPTGNLGIASGALPYSTALVAPETAPGVLNSPDETIQPSSCDEEMLKSEVASLFEEQIDVLLNIPDA